MTLDEVAAERPDARRRRDEDLLDDRFVRALDDSGFIAASTANRSIARWLAEEAC